MVHTDHRQPIRLKPPTTWALLALAAALFVAGVVVPHALLVAAGLILAGSLGLGGTAAGGDAHRARTSWRSASPPAPATRSPSGSSPGTASSSP